MNIKISENLKRFRKAKDITQEEVADFLGVSFQSISKWERGDCFPDIEMLPSLANFYNVSIDELMGMDEIRNREKLKETFRSVHELESEGRYCEAISMLRKSIKVFPNNYSLLSELALALTLESAGNENKLTLQKEAITLNEKVLANYTNEKVRSTARANLVFLYKSIGEQQKAIGLAKTLPHVWESREIILPGLYEGEEYISCLRKSIITVLGIICDKINEAEDSNLSEEKANRMVTLGPPECNLENRVEMIGKINRFLG